jgi:hypothetical protein
MIYIYMCKRFEKKLKDRLEFARGAENNGQGIYVQQGRGLTG